MSYLRRRRTDGEGQRVITLELFHGLVFVFAITQVSHLLLEHLRARPLSPEDDRPDEPQAPPRALACLASGIVGLFVPALVLAGLIITMLVAVIGSEYVAAARRRARGEPSPRESLEASVARRDRGS